MARTDDTTLSHTTPCDGTEIGCCTNDIGPPLVLVHGGLGDHTLWSELLPYRAPHHTVHAIDRRGRGASGDGPVYAPQREFEDVAGVVDAVTEDSRAGDDGLELPISVKIGSGRKAPEDRWGSDGNGGSR